MHPDEKPGQSLTLEKTDDVETRQNADGCSTKMVSIPARPQTRSPRSRRRLALLAGMLAVIALLASLWGIHGSGGPPRVVVETLTSGPVERILAVNGRTETDVHSDIRSLVTARVTEVRIIEGGTVTVGDELLILDASQQESRVRQELAARDGALLRQEKALADRDRAVSLGASIAAVVATNAERDLAIATADLSRLQAALEQAELALPDYRITSPITGVVLNRSVEPGDLVDPSEVLIRLANTENPRVEVQIDEIYADRIRPGQSAWLQLTGRREVATGKVSFVASEVDKLTGSLLVRLDFDEAPETQIGLTTLVNILIDTVENAVTVLRSALVANGPGKAVFVLEDGKARLTPITFVDWPADRVEVTSGLTEGDRVVLSPEGIQAGQPLEAQAGPEGSE